MGEKNKSQKEFDKALENYSQAIKYYNILKRSDKVTEIYRIMTSIQQDLLNPAQNTEINDLLKKIVDCFNSGHYNEAQVWSKRGIEYSRSIGDSKSELDFASYSIDALSEMGSYRQAIEEYKENILKAYDYRHDRTNTIHTLCRISEQYRRLGDYDEALTNLEKADQICKKLNNSSLRAQCLVKKGQLYLYNIRSLHDAEEYFTEVTNLVNLHKNDMYHQMQSYLELSSIHLYRKNYESAREKAGTAMELVNTYPSTLCKHMASVYEMYYAIYFAQKMYEEAKMELKNALDIYEKDGSRQQSAQAYINLSRLESEEKKYDEAIIDAGKATKIYDELGVQDNIMNCQYNFSLIHFMAGRLEEAGRILENAISNVNLNEVDPTLMAYGYIALGAISQEKGNQMEVISNLEKAVYYLDSVRSHIALGDLRVDFQGREINAYSTMIQTYFSIGNMSKAFQYIEKSKSRILLEQIRIARIRRPSLLPDSIKEEEDNLLDKMNNAITTNKKGSTPHTIENELRELWTRMNEIQPSSIEIKEYLSLRRGDSLDINEVVDLLATRDKACALEYYVLKNKLLIFLFRSNSQPEVYSKAIDRDIIKSCSDRIISYLDPESKNQKRAQSNVDMEMLLNEMSSYLIEPIVDHLDGAEHIHIIPHTFLHSVPIHALPFKGDALIDKYSVSYSPSASVLRYCFARPSRKLENALVMGSLYKDQPIPFALLEAKEISSILNCELTVENDFPKEKMVMEGKDVISFSSHAQFNAEDGLESQIILSDNEYLTAKEILRKQISADIVSLNACQTARSQEKPGDEMFGLVRSIMYAGAKSILASLWKVDDLASYITVTKFFEQFAIKKLNKSQSLREAQLYVRDLKNKDIVKILENLHETNPNIKIISEELEDTVKLDSEEKRFDQIYYWSPFIIIGDWQ